MIFETSIESYDAKQKIDEYINKGSITGNVTLELRNKPSLIEKYNIDEKNLKEIYIVWNNFEENYPYIIKCPIKSVSQRAYIINVKSRDRFKKYDRYEELKILKKDINVEFRHKASSSYELAFSYLLLQEKAKILYNLQKQNDIELYKLYIQASQFDYLLGLELIAKELKMDYLFRLDDDTI